MQSWFLQKWMRYLVEFFFFCSRTSKRLGVGVFVFVAPIFDLILVLNWSIILGVLMSNLDEKRVKFTSFESYSAYNIFCLTFKENSRVLIERKTLEAISRKTIRTIKSQRTESRRLEEHQPCTSTTPPCCSDRATHGLTIETQRQRSLWLVSLESKLSLTYLHKLL